MPALNFSRIDLDLLEPNFRDKQFELVSRCLDLGYSYHATRGYDTYGKQMSLWAKGRTQPGPKVTNAKPGQSAHNFGLAVDYVLDSNPKATGIQPDWRLGAYTTLVEEAKKLGLHSGIDYNDAPHVARGGMVTALDMYPLHLIWQKTEGDTLTRLQEVWKALVHE